MHFAKLIALICKIKSHYEIIIHTVSELEWIKTKASRPGYRSDLVRMTTPYILTRSERTPDANQRQQLSTFEVALKVTLESFKSMYIIE